MVVGRHFLGFFTELNEFCGIQDTLVKEKGYKPEPPAGLIPAFKTGLTPEAELINGRLAMFGLIAVIWGSIFTGTPVLDVINLGLGKTLY